MRSLSLNHTNTTLDCMSWLPVSVPYHPFKLPTSENYKAANPEAELIESESSEHRKASFGKIFAEGAWGSKSKSGPGSLLSATIRIRKMLDQVVDKLKIHLNKEVIRILDSSCGDMTWMPTFLEGRNDIIFTGFDIVPENIQQHRNMFKHQNWSFEVHDIVTDSINSSYDLILSRHTTQHLKTKDVLKVLQNFLTSRSLYLFTSNYPDVKKNSDLSENSQYRHRPINLFFKPFYLPPPICMSRDVQTDFIMLWDLSTISLHL